VNRTGAVAGVLVSVLSVSACTSWISGPCAAPPLVTTSGYPDAGGVVLHWWQPDGGSRSFDAGEIAWQAVVSPDGSTVAFASPDEGYSDTNGYGTSHVALLSLETGEVTRLSSDVPDARVDSLQWSVEGSEVAFTRSRDGGREREIVAARVEDGEERTLLILSDGQPNQFAWSSERQALLVRAAWSVLAPPASAPGRPPELPHEELWLYSLDTGDHVVVETPHSSITEFAWSPDGRFVAMAADIPGTTRPRLYVLDLESGISALVDRRRGFPTSLTWSGPYLLYTYFLRTPGNPVVLMRWDSRSRDRDRVDRPGLENVLDRSGMISAPRCSSPIP
jgi:dipeptidyl aminopeptidase/acylaminoacyl peptidase